PNISSLFSCKTIECPFNFAGIFPTGIQMFLRIFNSYTMFAPEEASPPIIYILDMYATARWPYRGEGAVNEVIIFFHLKFSRFSIYKSLNFRGSPTLTNLGSKKPP